MDTNQQSKPHWLCTNLVQFLVCTFQVWAMYWPETLLNPLHSLELQILVHVALNYLSKKIFHIEKKLPAVTKKESGQSCIRTCSYPQVRGHILWPGLVQLVHDMINFPGIVHNRDTPADS